MENCTKDIKLKTTKNLIEWRDEYVTPEMAKEYLNNNAYRCQRNLNPRRVKEIGKLILEDRMAAATIAIVLYKGIKYLVDGQHTCNSIIDVNKPTVCQIHIYEIDNEKDLNDIYLRYEGTSPRPESIYIRNEAQTHDLSWPATYNKLITEAAMIYEYGDFNLKIQKKIIEEKFNIIFNKQFKANLFGTYYKYGERARVIYLDENNKMYKNIDHIKKPAIFYTIMKCLNINEDFAKKFWIEVRDGEHLTIDTPQYKLREILKKNEKMSNKELYVLCTSAWNAARQNRTPNFFKGCYRPDYLPKLI